MIAVLTGAGALLFFAALMILLAKEPRVPHRQETAGMRRLRLLLDAQARGLSIPPDQPDAGGPRRRWSSPKN